MTSDTRISDDRRARELEGKGLYRRAAERWRVVLMSGKLTVEQQKDVMLHLRRCLDAVKRPRPTKVMSFMDVARAATATEARMGLSQPPGKAFRHYKN